MPIWSTGSCSSVHTKEKKTKDINHNHEAATVHDPTKAPTNAYKHYRQHGNYEFDMKMSSFFIYIYIYIFTKQIINYRNGKNFRDR